MGGSGPSSMDARCVLKKDVYSGEKSIHPPEIFLSNPSPNPKDAHCPKSRVIGIMCHLRRVRCKVGSDRGLNAYLNCFPSGALDRSWEGFDRGYSDEQLTLCERVQCV